MEGNQTLSSVCNGSAIEKASGNCSNAAGATIFIPTVMFLAGIFGNVLALFTLHKTRIDARTTKFYTLVTGLAWTDLIGIIMTSPSVLAAYVNKLQWQGGDVHCRFHGFAMTCFGIATPLIICAMAVERFLALKCVFFYSSNCKTGTARGLVLFLWLLVILYGMLPLFGFGSFEKQYPGTWCFLDFHSFDIMSNMYAYFYASVNLLLLFVMLVCNGYVMARLCHARFRRLSDSKGSITSEKTDMLAAARMSRHKQHSIEGQMIALMFALTTVFVLCWAPLMVRIIVTMATGKTNVYLDLLAVRLASLNQTLDPWLYIIVRRSLITRLRACTKRALIKIGIMHEETSANDDRVNIIGEHHESSSHNNNRSCRANNGNLDVKQEAKLCDVFSRPDVTRDGFEDNLNNRCLQLPDVTNTGDRGYVCRLHFGGAVSEGEEEGIYVKISFLSKRSTCESDSRSFDEDCKCDVTYDVTRSPAHPSGCAGDRVTSHLQSSAGYAGDRVTSHLQSSSNDLPKTSGKTFVPEAESTKTTDLTKDTMSANSLPYTNHLLNQHSEVIPDVLNLHSHQSLRKTRSTT